MVLMLGVDDVMVEEVVVEVAGEQSLDIFLASDAGNGVDDDEHLFFHSAAW